LSAAIPGNTLPHPSFLKIPFYEVEISWDLDATEQLTVYVNGGVMLGGGGSFAMLAVVALRFTDLISGLLIAVKSIHSDSVTR